MIDFITANAIKTQYVDKLTRCGEFEVSIEWKVKAHIQNLKNKNKWGTDSDIIKPFKTQLWKSCNKNEDLIYLGALKSTTGKYFSKSAVCVIGIEGPFSCKRILIDPFKIKWQWILPIVNNALLFDHKIR